MADDDSAVHDVFVGSDDDDNDGESSFGDDQLMDYAYGDNSSKSQQELDRHVSDITDSLARSGFLSIEAKRNITESRLIVSDESEIDRLQKRMSIVKSRQKARMVTASLRFHGSKEEWNSLTKSERYSKENVLAMLSCPANTGNLPKQLQECTWDNPTLRNTFHEMLLVDTDVFLARTAREEFTVYHDRPREEWRLRDWLPEVVPDCLPELVRAAPHAYKNYSIGSILLPKKVHLKVARSFFQNCDKSSLEAAVAGSGFPTCVTSDFNLMLYVTTKKSFRMLKVTDKRLLGSIDFAKRFAKSYTGRHEPCVHESLNYFSEDVRSDIKVATAYVRRWGKSYKFVGKSQKMKNLELARLACFGDSKAILQYIPGPLEYMLVRDKELILYLLRKQDCWLGPALWKIVAPTLKQDFDVCASAVAFRYTDAMDLPPRLRTFKLFWYKALRENINLWCDGLPEPFATELSLLEGLPMNGDVLRHCVQKFSYLRFEQNFWASVVANWIGSSECLYTSISALADESILSDKQFMIKACTDYPLLLENCTGPLSTDRELVSAATTTGHDQVLLVLSSDARRLYPDLCAIAISNYHNMGAIPDILELDEWRAKDIALAWFALGGSWNPDDEHDVFPTDFLVDHDILLAAAAGGDSALHIFSMAPTSVLLNKSLMLRALELNASLHGLIPAPLKYDFDILVRRFAVDECNVKSLATPHFQRESRRVLINFSLRVRELLANKQLFFKSVLLGLSRFSTSPLRHLDQGPETAVALKRLLAELLDVPVDGSILYLERAHRNLTRLGL